MVTAGKIIVGYRQVSDFRQRLARMAANEPCAASDENLQARPNPLTLNLVTVFGSDNVGKTVFLIAELPNAEP